MKRLLNFCLCMFAMVVFQVTHAQNTPDKKVFLTFLGGASARAVGPDPVVQNFGGTIYTYTGKPQKNDFNQPVC